MKYTILTGHNSLEENRFKTQAEFIDVLSRGAEIILELSLRELEMKFVSISGTNRRQSRFFGMRRMRWSIRWLLTGWGT